MRFNRILLITAFVAALASAPTHADSPQAPAGMPESWANDAAFSQTLPVDTEWWRSFNDPTLDSLIAMGLDRNYDVAMALRRIEMARNSITSARSAYFPTLGFDAGWSRARTSGMNAPVAGKAATGSYFDLGINMNWQIDIFGKVADNAKGAKAAYAATKAEYDGMMLTVTAKIATAYLQLRTQQAELGVVNDHIKSQKRVTEITEARHEAGLASMLDVQQARTTYYSTLAAATSINTSITATINALSVLVGKYPDELTPMLSQPANMPDYHHLVAVGVPMELLRRRPDIVQAEHTLAQYAAQLGVAKKDFLPVLTLSGSIGTSAHKAGDLFDKESLTYAIAPTLSWTIFDGFARKASVASAKEQMLAGIDNYNLTILNAVQEVETAMTTYVNDMRYIDLLSDAVNAAHESFTLSIDLYKQGLATFINVSDAQISLLQYSNNLILAKGQALADLVSLYEALAGGY